MTRLLLIVVLGVLIVRALWRLVSGIVEGVSLAQGSSGRPGTLRQSEMMERDPICGTYVLPSRALISGSGEEVRYFCSDTCRRAFAARQA